MCLDPELVFEISMQSYRLFDLDVVVVFYDIFFLAEVMGVLFEYNFGPCFLELLRTSEAIVALGDLDFYGHMVLVFEIIACLRVELSLEILVLGFVGLSFIMVVYLVEGNFS